MRPTRLATLIALWALVAVAMTGCVEGLTPNDPVEPSVEPPRTVTGLITELEFGKLSLRVDDGRQLIFDLQDSPMSEDELRIRMEALRPITVTYTASRGHLRPLSITDAVGPTPTATATG